MSYRLAALALAGALAAIPVSAGAQTAIAPGEAVIPIDHARDIAWNHGIGRIDEIELDMFTGLWEVDGTDATGRDVELDIDARTGTVVRIQR